MPTATLTEQAWDNDVLGLIDAPENALGESKLELWGAGEEPPDEWGDWGNPLNTTEPGYGGAWDADVGTEEYPSLEAGAHATAATLLGNSAYAGIVSNLREQGTVKSFATQVQDSPWASGHYGYALADDSPIPGATTSAGPNDTGATGVPTKATSKTTSATEAGLYSELPGGGLDPLNWPNDVFGGASSAASSVTNAATSAVTEGISAAVGDVWSEVEPFLVTAIFVVFGLGMMALGAYKAVSPSGSVKDALSGLGQTIARTAQEAPEAVAG